MNKKGFTLIELLMVVSIMAVISMIAIPNMININDGIKKENFLGDAKRLISLAKAKVNSDYTLQSENNITFFIADIQDEMMNDAEGIPYDSNSYVKYYIDNDELTYCVSLIGSKYNIGKNNCVKEKYLDISRVVKNN